MRLCMPRVYGRGAGLGNELIPWTKAFIASVQLDLRLLAPAFGLSPWGYRKYFGTSRLDWIVHRILPRVMPTIVFTEAEYLATGERDFGRALAKFAERHALAKRNNYLLIVEGMWGGYYALRNAVPFVWQTLYRSRGVAEKLYAVRQRLRQSELIVAVHMRFGDFAKPSETTDYRGRFNVSIPIEWYRSTCRSIREAVGERVCFVLLTNGRPDQIRDYIEEFHPVTTLDVPDSVCSDLLTMAHADLIVCSVSSFSMCAAWMSAVPYIWYYDNLQDHLDALSLWGHEPAQQSPDGTTAHHLGIMRASIAEEKVDDVDPRGVPLDDSGVLPKYLGDYLRARVRLKREEADLLLYGAVPKQRLG
jgi:hypothetical protein